MGFLGIPNHQLLCKVTSLLMALKQMKPSGQQCWENTLPCLLQKDATETSKVSQCWISRQEVKTSGDNLSNHLKPA